MNPFDVNASESLGLPSWLKRAAGEDNLDSGIPIEYLARMYPEVIQWGPNFREVRKYSEFLRDVVLRWESDPEYVEKFLQTWNGNITESLLTLGSFDSRLRNYVAKTDQDLAPILRKLDIHSVIRFSLTQGNLTDKKYDILKTNLIDNFFNMVKNVFDFSTLWGFTLVLESVAVALISAHLATAENGEFTSVELEYFTDIWSDAAKKFYSL